MNQSDVNSIHTGQQFISGYSESLKTEIYNYIAEHCYQENFTQPFVLASGKTSPYYFDLKQGLLNPNLLYRVGKLFLQQLKQEQPGREVKALAGLTMGADPIIYAICLAGAMENSNFPILPLIVRKEIKDHGSSKQIEGLVKKLNLQDDIVLIDDVITTGKSTLKAHDALVRAGFSQISRAMCVLDRNEGGREALAERQIELVSLFKVEDFRKKIEK